MAVFCPIHVEKHCYRGDTILAVMSGTLRPFTIGAKRCLFGIARLQLPR